MGIRRNRQAEPSEIKIDVLIRGQQLPAAASLNLIAIPTSLHAGVFARDVLFHEANSAEPLEYDLFTSEPLTVPVDKAFAARVPSVPVLFRGIQVPMARPGTMILAHQTREGNVIVQEHGSAEPHEIVRLLPGVVPVVDEAMPPVTNEQEFGHHVLGALAHHRVLHPRRVIL